MSLMFFIILNVFICIVALIISNDILHPVVLFCIPWIIFSIMLCNSEFYVDDSNKVYFYLSLGSLIFAVACFLGHRNIVINKNERLIEIEKSKISVKFNVLKFLTSLEVLCTIIILISYYKFIKLHPAANIFTSFYDNKEDYELTGVIGYIRNIILSTSLCVIIEYAFIDEKDKRRYKKYLKIQVVVYILNTLTKMTRNGILTSLLPIVVVYFVITKQKNLKVAKKMIIVIGAFLGIFALISIWKYWYIYQYGNMNDNILSEFYSYGAGPIVALQKKMESGINLKLYGENTFRFLIAINDKMRGTNIAPQLQQEFTTIGFGKITNVYTFYYYYICDFGWIYALIVQCIIGYMHGKIYKKMVKMDEMGIYLYAILTYPLVMQFFQDQYISLLSFWVQCVLIGVLVMKSNFLFYTSKLSNCEFKKKNRYIGINT